MARSERPRETSTRGVANAGDTKSPPVLERADAWLKRRRGTVVASIVVVSVLLRLVYLFQALDGPLASLHRSPMSDMHFNHVWAERISTGDLLGAQPLHPLHQWHEDLAAQHFARHPELEAALRVEVRDRGDGASPARLLWNRWYGGNAFHQEPVYAHLLATTYAVFGTDVRPMLVLQLLAGVLGNVLVHWIAQRYFGSLVGAVAGALAVLCGPLLYYEMLLLRDSLVALAGLWLVFLTQRAVDRPTMSRWLAAGAGFGLVLQLKSSLVILLGMVLLGMAAIYRSDARRLLVRSGAVLVAVAAVLLPAVVRNVAVGAPPFTLSSVGAITFVGANTADYGRSGGIPGDFFVSPRHAAEIMGRTEGRFLPAVREALATHDGVASYVRQLGGKLAAILWWYEIPNNTNFYYFMLHAPVLRLLPVTFAMVGPLALVGIALAAPGVRRSWPLFALVAANGIVLLAFGVFSRLRLPLVAPLLPFAAFALVRWTGWIAARRIAPVAFVTSAVALLALFAGRPLPEGQPVIRPSDYSAAYIAWYGPRIDEAYRRGDPCAAAEVYAESLRYEPEAVRRIDGAGSIRFPHEAQLAAIFRKAHDRRIAALERCRERVRDERERLHLLDEIEEHRRRIAQIDRGLASASPRP